MTSSKLEPTAFLQDAPAPQPYRVERDGERDLSFNGWLLGEECVTTGAVIGGNRQTCVRIHVTVGGKYVVQVRRAKWSVASDTEISSDVLITDSPEEIVDWLKASNRGSFGQASREAWNKACAAFPPLEPFATENIE